MHTISRHTDPASLLSCYSDALTLLSASCRDAGALLGEWDLCRGIIGRAYYVAGAVCGVTVGLRKLWS